MTCAELETFLYPYLDGEFDAHEQLEFERHLAGCPACAQKMHSELGFLSVMRRSSQVAAAKAPESLREAIQVGLHRERQRAALTSWFNLGAAAGVLVFASGTNYYYRPLSKGIFIQDAPRRHANALPLR